MNRVTRFPKAPRIAPLEIPGVMNLFGCVRVNNEIIATGQTFEAENIVRMLRYIVRYAEDGIRQIEKKTKARTKAKRRSTSRQAAGKT